MAFSGTVKTAKGDFAAPVPGKKFDPEKEDGYPLEVGGGILLKIKKLIKEYGLSVHLKGRTIVFKGEKTWTFGWCSS